MSRRRGQTIVLFSVMAVALIGAAGLVVDLGQLMNARAKARNAADSIVLAGAMELRDPYNASRNSQAIAKARAYAQINGVNPDAELSVVSPLNGNANRIEAVVTENVPLFFMRIFGQTRSSVRARAVAGVDVGRGRPNLLPIGAPDTAIPGGCILWGPSNQCKDVPPSQGGSLGSQYKGLVNLGVCNESAQPGSDCGNFDPADNYGNKPSNVNGWIGNGCNCEVYGGNDIEPYNGNLGSNVSTPMRAQCGAQGFSDNGGAYGLFTVLVYNKVVGSPPSLNIIGYAVYKVYCSDIRTSSASGTFVSFSTGLTSEERVPDGIPVSTLIE